MIDGGGTLTLGGFTMAGGCPGASLSNTRLLVGAPTTSYLTSCTISADSEMDITGNASDNASVNNSGTFSITAGKTLTMSATYGSFHQNSGTLNIAGSLVFAGGSFYDMDGTINGTVILDSSVGNPSLLLSAAPANGGTFSFVGSSTGGASTAFVTGTAGFPVNLPASATINIAPASNLPTAASLTVRAPATFTNAGTINLSSSNRNNDVTLYCTTLLNSGTLTSNPGPTADGGRTLSLAMQNSGTFNINASTSITSITNTGTVNLAAGKTLSVDGNFVQSSGTLSTKGAFALTYGLGTFVDNGGTIVGSVSLYNSRLAFGPSPALGSFSLTGTSGQLNSNIPSGMTVDVHATGPINSGGLTVNLPSPFTNNGTLVLSSVATNIPSGIYSTAASPASMINTGTFTISAGNSLSSNSQNDPINVTNSGVINANFSTSISSIANTGTVNIAPDIALAAGTFSQSAGTLNLSQGAMFWQSSFSTTGGTINGLVQLSHFSTLVLTPASLQADYQFLPANNAILNTLKGSIGAGTSVNYALGSFNTAMLGVDSTFSNSGTFTTTTSVPSQLQLNGLTLFNNSGTFNGQAKLNTSGQINNTGTFIQTGEVQVGNFTNSGTAVIDGPQTWTSFRTFSNTAGISTFQTDAGGTTGTFNLTVAGSGGEIDFNSSQHLAALNLSTTGTAKVVNPSSGHFVLVSKGLNFGGSSGAWAGLLDLQSNDMIVRSSSAALAATSLASITDQLHTGLRIGSAGITSSSAGMLTTLGSMLNVQADGTTPAYTTFDGQTSLTTNDVLVKFTYFGDADLSGDVSANDYTLIDNGFNAHSTGWQNGDFNYDGIVDGSDYSLIDNAFNMQGGSISAMPMSAVASSEAASVPEPVVSILGLATLAFFLPRHREKVKLK